MKKILALLLALLMLLNVCACSSFSELLQDKFSSYSEQDDEREDEEEEEEEDEEEEDSEELQPMSAKEVYDKALASVVTVFAIYDETYYSQGSGFFIDENGTVVTNYHVIDETVEGYVQTASGKEYEILSVLGYDPNLDVAILKTKAKNTVPLEECTDIETGEPVFSLGTPEGFQWSITDGIVAQADRVVDGQEWIQFTAPVSHGNSGGPLLDEYARVVGISTLVYVDGQNLNFAIPIEKIHDVSLGSGKTLLEVHDLEYGQAENTSWDQLPIAWRNDETLALWCDLPVEINESDCYEFDEDDPDSTSVDIQYTDENGMFFDLSAYIEAPMTSAEAEEYEEAITSFLQESLEDISSDPDDIVFQTTQVSINDVDWNTCTFKSDTDYGRLIAGVYVCYQDDCTITVMVMTVVDDDTAALSMEWLVGIISSLKIERYD